MKPRISMITLGGRDLAVAARFYPVISRICGFSS
jgi:hypothetical protein